MKTLWNEQDRGELRRRVELVKADAAGQWGVLVYRHLDHRLRQCGA